MNQILENTKFIDQIKSSGTCLFIDTKALINNYNLITTKLPDSKIFPVIKNNAYGLGAKDIAFYLNKVGCKDFFVASFEEALHLYSHIKDINIYVFNGVFKNQEKIFLENNFIPVLNTLSQVTFWNDIAKNQGKKLSCLFHIESGLNRFGLTKEDVIFLNQNKKHLESLDILYILSHFACADIEQHSSVKTQYDIFSELIKYFPNSKYSLSASYSMFLDNKYSFDMIRPAIALYGGNPMPYKKENPMQQVIYLYSTIKQIKQVKKEEYLGYGHIWQAKRDSDIAILPIGYADGIMRSTVGKGYVYIDDYKAPIIGKISMDFITIDITDLPTSLKQENTLVTIIDDKKIPLDTFAANAGTINCEIINVLTKRYPKIFI